MAGQTVCVMGWVNKRRDLGQLIFIALRDRTGLLQAAIDEAKVSKELYEKVVSVRGEYVVAITGVVALRTTENINENMQTGKVEVIISEIRILAESEVPPFSIADEGVREDMRLKYRYLDLRKPELQNNLFIRHKAAQITRNFLSNEGFIEVETPIMANSSPEGARDYLVPSRVHPGTFYALPQSPQVFKQLLMVSGFDKYFQIAKCFRDEDLRADRQPEFTQIDIEMSFIQIHDIFSLAERLIQKIFTGILGFEVSLPIAQMTYAEAMERYGVDKPDIRFGMELKNITDIVRETEFVVFKSAIENGGSVRGINANGCANMPRKQIDSLVEYVKDYRAKGLAWITITESGEVKTTLSKFFSEEKIAEIIKAFDGKNGDLILLCADKDEIVMDSLGNLRNEVAKEERCIARTSLSLFGLQSFRFWNGQRKTTVSMQSTTLSQHLWTRTCICLIATPKMSVRKRMTLFLTAMNWAEEACEYINRIFSKKCLACWALLQREHRRTLGICWKRLNTAHRHMAA